MQLVVKQDEIEDLKCSLKDTGDSEKSKTSDFVDAFSHICCNKRESRLSGKANKLFLKVDKVKIIFYTILVV